jgi:ferric-dicitrate binding protein FerR (iron transport regulator)
MTTNQQDLRPGEEEALQGLLREMAPEADPSPEVRERIRQAVATEWRAAVGPTRIPATRRWQRPALALAAGLGVAAIALGVFQSDTATPGPLMATIARLSGAVEAGVGADWQPVATGQSLSVGEQLVTGPRGKAALTLARGVTLRLDTDTRIALAGIDRVVVERGAVYLDSGLDSGERPAAGPALRIETSFGSTQHLGTQYEVRVTPAEMRVSVREGQVALTDRIRPETPVVAQAGEQLSIESTGALTHGVVGRQDPRWNWITDVTPPYAIEDRRLSEFLAWVCRESGRELVFASPEVKVTAEEIILRGSVAGLSPDAALAAVMATTNLSYSDDNGRLTIQPALRQAATR